MKKTTLSSAQIADTRPHYEALNGLRGIAAMVVVWYHIFEGFATSPLDQIVNHGYLAVDFFFLLSGFVIGYAYDERWSKMTLRQFAWRRFVRLHPMVVLGAVLGGSMFYTQGCDWWEVSAVSLSALLGACLLNAFLIPATPSTEIRGIGEMYPLNGPSWSLFFEYVAYGAYALGLRHLPRLGLLLVAILSLGGLCWFVFGVGTGSIGIGWTMRDNGLLGGLLRALFSFSAGLLLFRSARPKRCRGGFVIGAIAIVALCAMPRLGGESDRWLNGIYELLCIGVIFPLVVYWGASTSSPAGATTRLYRFLGDISYPLYIVHYPFVYLYIAWVKNNDLTFVQSLPGALSLFFGSIGLAYLLLKVYDEPIRSLLGKRGGRA